MATLERYQNPTPGSTVRLQLFSYNSGERRDFDGVNKVEIYYLDPTARTDANPDGRTLFQTVDGADVTHSDTGVYEVVLPLSDPQYVIGQYRDVWYVDVDGQEGGAVENEWQIYPDLWYTTPLPIVYDFSFAFRPNKVRKGSRRYLIVEITPNVPHQSDLRRYYENLAIASPLKVYIEQACGDCLPQEEDLRLLVDGAGVEVRDKNVGYYFLDTTDMDEGIYDVWFALTLGETYQISDKQQLQIF